MSLQKSKQVRFEVTTRCVYVPAESKPEQGYHFFAYQIKIKNTGSTSAQLLNRHWVITDSLGRVEEVRGPGVIGQQPQIPPGQVFEYESACPLATASGSMKGSYEMRAENGDIVQIEVPEFFLIAPFALH